MNSDTPGRVRFLAQKPFHPYSFGESRPLYYIDPLGLQVEMCE